MTNKKIAVEVTGFYLDNQAAQPDKDGKINLSIDVGFLGKDVNKGIGQLTDELVQKINEIELNDEV